MEALNPDHHALAWALYCGAFVLAYWALGPVWRKLPTYALRQSFKALLVVLVLTPVLSVQSSGWYVPAWLYLGYEMILEHEAEATRALVNLGWAAALMLIVLTTDLARHYRRR